MINNIPTEIISNIISILLVIILFYKFFLHKKQLTVIEKLSDLNDEKAFNSRWYFIYKK